MYDSDDIQWISSMTSMVMYGETTMKQPYIFLYSDDIHTVPMVIFTLLKGLCHGIQWVLSPLVIKRYHTWPRTNEMEVFLAGKIGEKIGDGGCSNANRFIVNMKLYPLVN